MKGFWESQRIESATNPTPCLFSSSKTTFGSVLAKPPTDTSLHKKQDVVKGDRVLAMPYWSQVDERCYIGSGVVPFSWAWWNADAGGYPIPTACGPMRGGGRTVGEFSIWQYLPALPSAAVTHGAVSAAQWKFCQEMANTKARAKLNKALVSLPLLFAERKQTLEMIGRNVKSMGQLALAAQQRDLAKYKKAIGRLNKRRVAKDSADRHLELIFGFLPLMDEVEGLAEFLALPNLDFIRADGLHGIETGEVSLLGETLVKWPHSDQSEGPNNVGNIAKIYRSGLVTKRASVRVALRYKLDTQLAGDARRLGFEPIGAAFDLYPLSFVVGWFSNLDHYVKGLAPLVGVEFVTGSENRRRKVVGSEATAIAPYPTQPLYGMTRVWTKQPTGTDVTSRSVKMLDDVRTVLTAPPELSLHWDVDVGLYEATAGLSLLIQRYIKPLKRLTKQKTFRYRGPRPKWLRDVRYRKV